MNIWKKIEKKVSFHAVYEKSIIEALNYAKNNNFTGIQLAVESPHFSFEHLSHEKRVDIKNFCINNGLYINIHAPDGISLFNTNHQLQNGIFEYFKELFKFAKDISSQLVTIHLGTMTDFPTDSLPELKYPEEDIKLYRNSLKENLNRLISLIDGQFILSIENYRVDSFTLDVLQSFIKNKKCWLCYDVAKAHYDKHHNNFEVYQFFQDNQKSIKQVHLHDVNENGRAHRVIGSGIIDFNEMMIKIKESPVIDYCIEVRPHSKALESLRNLKQILNS
ncbi:sugar phosphate isomerase/epimerase family protein [Promethearchaeum syntrophicum]|uniref:Sugar phosphate isomerase/epimerase family protein n=1 Tax=Promethearchaeum syntrophicum TaxID=2594042 RepID=A0A5B9D8P1_9ARCH|nr:TIM barrel protein [Candidatus Prometheoarchaeum syntrophicum]QEE15140.1 Xylose isomerase-like TIM barrel [Candidatus Prometheoarchaeum syntrophicum]